MSKFELVAQVGKKERKIGGSTTVPNAVKSTNRLCKTGNYRDIYIVEKSTGEIKKRVTCPT